MTRVLGTFDKDSRAVHTVDEPDLSGRQQEVETNHREARDRVDIGQVARRMVALRRREGACARTIIDRDPVGLHLNDRMSEQARQKAAERCCRDRDRACAARSPAAAQQWK